MPDYPIRQRSTQGQPREEFSNARTCRACSASFRLLAPGKTGERGIWREWKWFCSQECADTYKGKGICLCGHAQSEHATHTSAPWCLVMGGCDCHEYEPADA